MNNKNDVWIRQKQFEKITSIQTTAFWVDENDWLHLQTILQRCRLFSTLLKESFELKKIEWPIDFFFASLRLFSRDHLHAKETNHKKKPHAHTLFKICWREFHLYVEELFALFDNRWSIKKNREIFKFSCK